jgi:ribosomal protein L40E
MAKFHSNLLIAGLALASFAAVASTNQEPAKQEPVKKESVALKQIKASKSVYVGAKKCKSCHNKEARGKIYDRWSEMRHSKALETLKSEKALEVGKERGIEKPWEAAQCLKCHETAFDEPKERKHKKFKKDLGVQCESCHGPGSDHVKKRLAAAKAEKVEEGTLRKLDKGESFLPDELLCRKCHNEESPFYKEFDYGKSLETIQHLHPKREKPRVVPPKKKKVKEEVVVEEKK